MSSMRLESGSQRLPILLVTALGGLLFTEIFHRRYPAPVTRVVGYPLSLGFSATPLLVGAERPGKIAKKVLSSSSNAKVQTSGAATPSGQSTAAGTSAKSSQRQPESEEPVVEPFQEPSGERGGRAKQSDRPLRHRRSSILLYPPMTQESAEQKMRAASCAKKLKTQVFGGLTCSEQLEALYTKHATTLYKWLHDPRWLSRETQGDAMSGSQTLQWHESLLHPKTGTGRDLSWAKPHGLRGLLRLAFWDRSDQPLFEELLDLGLEVNPGAFAVPPLELAIEAGRHDIAAFLIERGAKVSRLETAQRAPTCVAASLNDADCLRLLLDAGADPLEWESCENRRNALHIAAREGYDEICELLVEGVKPEKLDLFNTEGWTALYLAALRGNDKMLRFLKEKGASLHPRGHTCDEDEKAADCFEQLVQQVRKSKLPMRMLRLLVQEGADIDNLNANGDSLFSYALAEKWIEGLAIALGSKGELKAEDIARLMQSDWTEGANWLRTSRDLSNAQLLTPVSAVRKDLKYPGEVHTV